MLVHVLSFLKGVKMNEPTKPTHFVLVHGAGHGAWCWYKIRCLLENAGHKVTCFDLTGAGIDATDPSSVQTFEEYNKPLSDFMSVLPHDEKVVLVGHSAGGLSVTSVVHDFGHKIAVAAYVGANMLRNGFCTDEDIEAASTQLSDYGDINEMKTRDGILKEEYQRIILYNTSPKEDQILASMLLRPSPPGAVFVEARFGNGEEADKVRRIYVKTMQDHVLSPTQQDMMINLWPPSEVFSVDSDHSPFFSAPTELCEVLLKVSASIPQA